MVNNEVSGNVENSTNLFDSELDFQNIQDNSKSKIPTSRQEINVCFNTIRTKHIKTKFLNVEIKNELKNIKFYAEAQAESIGRLLDKLEEAEKFEGEMQEDENDKNSQL